MSGENDINDLIVLLNNRTPSGLGPELFVSPTIGGSWTDNLDGSYTQDNPTGAFSELYINTLEIGKEYLLKVSLDSITGNILSFRASGIKWQSPVTGVFEVVVTGVTSTKGAFVRTNGGVATNCTISGISIREIL